MVRFARGAAKLVAQQTVGRLPRSSARLFGKLAKDGGTPVRDVRLRPWASRHTRRWAEWYTSVGPAFRNVFLSGEEGLPQTRQKEFAEQWAGYCGCRHALLLPHGTDALRLGLAALFDHDGLSYGGEVIVPNLSFIASATAPLDRRFGVALVDVDHDTLNIDPASVEAAILPGKTKAIMAVHQFGQPADMSRLRSIAQRHGLRLVEDAAQAHGAAWEGMRVGSLGDFAAFSFQSAKNLSCGEGGAFTTNDSQLFDRAYSLHNVGRTRSAEARWEHQSLGWNCRSNEYHAALLIQRLAKFDEEQETRRRNFLKLGELLADSRSVSPLGLSAGCTKHAMYMFVMRYRPVNCGDTPLDEFVSALQVEGVPINRCYSFTIAQQPAMETLRRRHPDYVRAVNTPVADRAVGEILYIAADIFLGNESDILDISDSVKKVERHYCRGRSIPS